MRRKAQGKERMGLNTTRQRQRKPRTLCSSEAPGQLEDHAWPECLGQCDMVIPLLDVIFQSVKQQSFSGPSLQPPTIYTAPQGSACSGVP